MSVLVCGGAGYIGSHTCVELLENGNEVIVADNLSNSSLESLKRVELITGKKVIFEKLDLCNIDCVEYIFNKYPQIDSVINFAGYKAVGESVMLPLEYYTNNILIALNLLNVMKKLEKNNFIFSSSATVYGKPECIPICETDFVGGTTNPYGTSKLYIEQIIKDYCSSNPSFNAVILRYFNPIGAHHSGLIGEDPNGIPNNLVPYIAQVAVGKLEEVHVFGDDYDTFDGTGVRDYIHVMDLARGHVAALNKTKEECGLFICNLGTGKGYSVIEVIKAYEKAANKRIPYVIDKRREGDIGVCYADTTKAYNEMNWRAELGLDDMCASSWKWQYNNPNGYKQFD